MLAMDGYCLINNVFILFIYSYSVPQKRLAMLFLKVSKPCEINMQCGPEKSKLLLLQ